MRHRIHSTRTASLVAEDLGEVAGKIETEGFRRPARVPDEMLGQHFRPLVRRRPALHQTCVEVDDPVFGYVSLVRRTLGHAVVAATAWREHLSDKDQLRCRHLSEQATRLLRRNNEHVRLHDVLRLELDIERLNLPLVPAVGSAYLQGGVYGGTVCLPVPDIEKNNNPNIVASQIITGVRGEFPVP